MTPKREIDLLQKARDAAESIRQDKIRGKERFELATKIEAVTSQVVLLDREFDKLRK